MGKRAETGNFQTFLIFEPPYNPPDGLVYNNPLGQNDNSLHAPPGQAGIGTTPRRNNNPDYVNCEPVPQGTPLGGIATLITQTLIKVVET